LSGIFYATATPLLKASIGALLLRFVRRKLYIYIIYIGIVVSVAGNLWTFFELLLYCSPPAHFWDPVNNPGTCKAPAQLAKATLGQNSINFVTDVVFGVLPAFVVAELQMNKNTKISLASILLIGNWYGHPISLVYHRVESNVWLVPW
jgi:heme/copper-type cytochrome/quinol oxidase subunit 4